MSEQEFAGCQVCGRKDVTLKKDGTVRHHAPTSSRGSSFLSERQYRCDGAGKPPKRIQYGVRFKPDGPVFAENSRAKAEALRDKEGRGVLVAHEFVPHQPSTDEWYEITK